MIQQLAFPATCKQTSWLSKSSHILEQSEVRPYLSAREEESTLRAQQRERTVERGSALRGHRGRQAGAMTGWLGVNLTVGGPRREESWGRFSSLKVGKDQVQTEMWPAFADQESTPALSRELLVCGNCQCADVKRAPDWVLVSPEVAPQLCHSVSTATSLILTSHGEVRFLPVNVGMAHHIGKTKLTSCWCWLRTVMSTYKEKHVAQF